MTISNDILRGHTETIILNILRQGDSYGYEIGKKILEASDGLVEFTEATIYIAFRRMEKEGLIASYWGDGVGGARRRYYTITDYGLDVYRAQADNWKTISKTLNNLIGGDIND
ncbi:MAG TPA: helix-turn-helix transcriptional regulator [Candidatus Faecicola pullistercoris]|nr:helix-turn-helix transcriptional regulator [Candidatus Faecicola pullistercoris]